MDCSAGDKVIPLPQVGLMDCFLITQETEFLFNLN